MENLHFAPAPSANHQGAVQPPPHSYADAHAALNTPLAASVPLKGVVLASDARVRFSGKALQELAAAEAERHARLGLTGHAYFHDNRLIEYIEGPVESIEALVDAYDRDPRFSLSQVVRAATLPTRRFNGWSLDICGDDELMDLRLEHVLEALLQNFASSLFGQERTQSAIWRLVDAIARRQANAGKTRRATRLVTAH